jgi:hypothetical protein
VCSPSRGKRPTKNTLRVRCAGVHNRKVNFLFWTGRSQVAWLLRPAARHMQKYAAGSFILNLPSRRSITSSARTSREVGTWGTRVFAALKLMTSSKVVGCSTGRSAGLAPLSIRSTAYVRLRRPSGGTGSSNWSRMIRRLQPRRSRDAVRRSPAQLSAQASRSSPDVQALISSARKRANALSNSLGVWASMMWNCRPSVRIASSVPRIWVAAPGCWD